MGSRRLRRFGSIVKAGCDDLYLEIKLVGWDLVSGSVRSIACVPACVVPPFPCLLGQIWLVPDKSLDGLAVSEWIRLVCVYIIIRCIGTVDQTEYECLARLMLQINLYT